MAASVVIGEHPHLRPHPLIDLDSFDLEVRGTVVFSHAMNSGKDMLEIRNKRKGEKSLVLKEFA
jgi:hypothetical protein